MLTHTKKHRRAHALLVSLTHILHAGWWTIPSSMPHMLSIPSLVCRQIEQNKKQQAQGLMHKSRFLGIKRNKVHHDTSGPDPADGYASTYSSVHMNKLGGAADFPGGE